MFVFLMQATKFDDKAVISELERHHGSWTPLWKY